MQKVCGFRFVAGSLSTLNHVSYIDACYFNQRPNHLSMKRIYLSLLIMLAFCACNKNSHKYDKETYPARYDYSESRPGAARLFTKNGEVKDEKTIGGFIERRDAAKLLYFKPLSIWDFSCTVELFNQDSVRFSTSGYTKCSLFEWGNDRYLIAKDTLSMPTNSAYDHQYYLMQVRNSFSNHQPLYETLIGDWFPQHRFKPVYYMRHTPEGLEVPFIYSLLFPPDWNPTIQTYVNTLNEKGYTSIADKDTLLVQEIVSVLKKK